MWSTVRRNTKSIQSFHINEVTEQQKNGSIYILSGSMPKTMTETTYHEEYNSDPIIRVSKTKVSILECENITLLYKFQALHVIPCLGDGLTGTVQRCVFVRSRRFMWTCLSAQEPSPYIRRARADSPGSVCQDAVRRSLKRGVLCWLNGGVADVTVILGCCCYDTRAVIDWNCCRIWIIGFLTLFHCNHPWPWADAQQLFITKIHGDGRSVWYETFRTSSAVGMTDRRAQKHGRINCAGHLVPSATSGFGSSHLQCCERVAFNPCVAEYMRECTLLNVQHLLMTVSWLSWYFVSGHHHGPYQLSRNGCALDPKSVT